MYVKQISAFIENAPGKLADFTRMLGEKGIDLMSLSIADTTDFGILRFIVADYEQAVKQIEEEGYAVSLTDVLAVEVPDRPGGLSQMLRLLGENDVSIEYLYSFVRNRDGKALIVFRVSDNDQAKEILEKNHIPCLSQEEMSKL